MKVALFYPVNVIASWYSLGGYAKCLKSMGHEVVDVPLPGNCYHESQRKLSEVASFPDIATLNSCDIVLLTYLEHINGWMELLYGSRWSEVKVPVIARFDESFDRVDLQLPDRWTTLAKWATRYSFPGAQDAKQFKGQWLVYGADQTMFNLPFGFEKKLDLGFVGSLYQKRRDYVSLLLRCIPDIPFYHGTVLVQDLLGVRYEESTKLLAENYGMLKIFFCLPPMSNLLVCKVFEAMSCRTMVMFPRLRGDAAENLTAFEDSKEIVYYDDVKDAEQKIRFYLKHDWDRNEIATKGRIRVSGEYSLTKMFEHLLSLA